MPEAAPVIRATLLALKIGWVGIVAVEDGGFEAERSDDGDR